MIKTKQDLRYYMERDAVALGKKGQAHPRFFGDEIWKFQRLLRKCEYYSNLTGVKKRLLLPMTLLAKYRFKKMSLKLGFAIPLNVFAEGLSIAHYGTLVVNPNAKVGKNCRIHECVNIGSTNGSDRAPVIGDNVFIATGAKIIGDISIADGVAIGAGAVVVKPIEEPNVTYGGVPAKKISDNGSCANLCPDLFE